LCFRPVGCWLLTVVLPLLLGCWLLLLLAAALLLRCWLAILLLLLARGGCCLPTRAPLQANRHTRTTAGTTQFKAPQSRQPYSHSWSDG
jgi:apolipoprotein N-acyltransferase